MKKIEKYAAILCGGSGSRANLGYNKAFFRMDTLSGEKTMLEVTLGKFADFDKIVVVSSESDLEAVKKIAQNYGADVVLGGETRTQSAFAALKHLQKGAKNGAVVAIHDAARPHVSRSLIDKTVESAVECGSGVAAVKVIDSLKRAEGMTASESVSRDNMYAIQTPQTFRFKEIYEAYAKADGAFADDGEVYQRAGHVLKLVEGEYSNKKMTVEADFAEKKDGFQTIGVGFDVHKLVKNRALILGGVEIPYKKGLLGHSDADVLLHAVSDALLSAAQARDIGVLFPDNDPRNKDMDSMVILKTAHERLAQSGQKIGFISAVIMAQKPKLAGYINEMRECIAKNLEIEPKKVNISATTTEFLGIVGRGKAIAVHATCLCSKAD